MRGCTQLKVPTQILFANCLCFGNFSCANFRNLRQFHIWNWLRKIWKYLCFPCEVGTLIAFYKQYILLRLFYFFPEQTQLILFNINIILRSTHFPLICNLWLEMRCLERDLNTPLRDRQSTSVRFSPGKKIVMNPLKGFSHTWTAFIWLRL